jgi:hypothetical protein
MMDRLSGRWAPGSTAIIILLILISATAVWARGGREDPLVQADRLIADQKYDEAILYLSDFMKLYPERFDQAQTKMRRIYRIRDAYNKRAIDLIETMINEPTNEAKKIAMIRELENFEKNPSPAVKAFISQTKDVSLFTYNRAKFEEIMTEGRRLIDQRRFAEAARAYQSGFELYRPEFIDAGYDPVFVADIFGKEAQAIDMVTAFQQAGAIMEATFLELATVALAGDATGYATTWPMAQAAALNLAETRRQVVEAGRHFEAAFAALSAANDTVTDSSYLPFAYRLMLGRRTETGLEGIAGAIDAQWTLAVGQAWTALETTIEANMSLAKTAYDSTRWATARNGFETAALWVDRSLPVLALWALYVPHELDDYATPFGEAILASKGSDYLRIIHLAAIARLSIQLADIQAAMDTAAANLAALPLDTLDRTSVLQQLATRRSDFLAARNAITALRSASGSQAERLRTWTTAEYSDFSSLEVQGLFDGNLTRAIDKTNNFEIRTVATAAAFEYGLIDRDAQQAMAALERGRQYLEGLPSDDPDLPDAIFKYPTRSITELATADTILRRVATELRTFTAKYRGEQAFIASAVSVQEWTERGNALATSAAARITETATLAAQAREQKQQADSIRLEAERRVTEANNAVRLGNYEIARERINRARERFLVSLSFEQNAELRRTSDQIVTDIAAAILRAENDLVVADTRRLLNDGKTLYLQGSFDRAETVLLQARARWSNTNATPEVEVEYWLRLVQTALTVKTGRDIPTTAPLFPEMSQMLSLAQKFYDEGATLLNRGDKTSALRAFAQSRQKIAEVKVIFPLNQTARVLELKIDQLSDAGEFNRKFARLFEEARTKINQGVDMATAYSDLKDLEAINPRYPGLRVAIEQAEIRLGFRQAPPDPRAIAQARSLTEAATRIFDSGDVARFAFARTQLEEAILLDPNNAAAALLKDRIATYIGGDSTIVLTSAAETLYNEAVAFFTGGNYISARARLTRLAEVFPRGGSVQKVADLDSRLRALGY